MSGDRQVNLNLSWTLVDVKLVFTLVKYNLEKFHSELVDSTWSLLALYIQSLYNQKLGSEVGIYILILSEHISEVCSFSESPHFGIL